MRIQRLKPGQVGDYWPSKKPGRERDADPWCLTWLDKSARQVRRKSLGTTDFQEACHKVAEHAVLNTKPRNGDPSDVPISTVLLSYWEEYAKDTASAKTTKSSLRLWNEFWGDRMVSELTRDEQANFRKFVGEGKLKPSTIDKVLSTGRAALGRAVAHGMLTSFPKITYIETEEDKRSRPPMGVPIKPVYAARLLDAVKCKHLFFFIMIIGNTLTRNGAALELTRGQFDEDENALCLNPKGRRQNKKFRATVPVTPTLKRWLLSEKDQKKRYVLYNDKPVKSIRTAWNKAVRDAGLPTGYTPYSFRHGISREMKRQGVPRDQISHYLGHIEKGAAKTTAIYAPMEAQDCAQAAAVIEDVMNEIRKLVKSANLDDPNALLAGDEDGRMVRQTLSPDRRKNLESLVLNGTGVMETARQIGVSTTLVYRYRKRLTGRTALN